MKTEVIFLIIQIVAILVGFAMGKYVPAKTKEEVVEKLNVIVAWAEKFVRWARQFMDGKTGQEKMAAVVEQLKAIADEAGLNVTEDQIKAIAQTAYDAMIAGEAETAIEIEELEECVDEYRPQTTTIVINAAPGTVAVATDDVPDGALDTNSDGTVNKYDEDGTVTGTATPEEVEEAMQNVSAINNEG